MLRIGWFSTGRGPGSQALLKTVCEQIKQGRLPLEIAYVFCNRARGELEPADQFLDLVERYGLPAVTLSSNEFRKQSGGAIARTGEPLPGWRIDYDRAILRRVEPFGTQIAVLAGYMLIAPELCRHMALLNLHPAAPGGPVGIWQDVIWQLVTKRATQSGITVFRATPQLDAGPALTYCQYPLIDAAIAPLWKSIEDQEIEGIRGRHGESLPLFAEIRRRGAARESPLLIATLAALASGRIDPKAVSAPEVALGTDLPLDLSPEVEQAVAADL